MFFFFSFLGVGLSLSTSCRLIKKTIFVRFYSTVRAVMGGYNRENGSAILKLRQVTYVAQLSHIQLQISLHVAVEPHVPMFWITVDHVRIAARKQSLAKSTDGGNGQVSMLGLCSLTMHK